MSELFDMLLQTSFQQGGVGRPLVAHFVMRDDLVLRLLNQDQFAELIRLVRLALADHFTVRLKYTEQLSLSLVLPRSTRSRVWRSTCWTRGIISSSCFLALCRTDRLPRLTRPAMSAANFLACPVTRLVISNSWR